MEKLPSYDGSGLVNLIAEIESVLGGEPPMPGLGPSVDIGESSTIVLVLFDGLGVAQLEHPAAGSFRSSLAATLTCGFPSTTTVSLSTVATGLPPSQSGATGHMMYYPDLDEVVNTLKWIDKTGQPVPYPYPEVLPGPNLWERLRARNVEPISVQPGSFQGTPLSRVLYRGARFEPTWDVSDQIEATVALAAEPARFVFSYVPFVDVTGHSVGLGSPAFSDAMQMAGVIWEGIVGGVRSDVTVLGTADHGLLEVSETNKVKIRGYDEVRFAGDARALQVWGEGIDRLAEDVGGRVERTNSLFGPAPSATAMSRFPEAMIFAPEGVGFFPPAFDRRLFAYHGGLSVEEMEIPLLIG